MYTVVRFVSDTVNDDSLFALGKALNRTRPGMFDKLDKGDSSFSCSVAVGGGWAHHSNEIIQLVKRHRRLIKGARKSGITVSIDTAIEPDDMRGVNMLSLLVDQALIGHLISVGSDLEFSCYVMRRKQVAVKSGKTRNQKP